MRLLYNYCSVQSPTENGNLGNYSNTIFNTMFYNYEHLWNTIYRSKSQKLYIIAIGKFYKINFYICLFLCIINDRDLLFNQIYSRRCQVFRNILTNNLKWKQLSLYITNLRLTKPTIFILLVKIFRNAWHLCIVNAGLPQATIFLLRWIPVFLHNST